MKPKRQQWVRVLIDHFIDDNEPQPRTVFKTTDNQPPLDDMTNVRAVVAPGQVIEVWDGGFRVNTEPPLQRPPIGLVPRYLVAEQRLRDIDLAIARYTRVNKPIPTEWEAERLELVEFERKRQNGRGDLPLHSAMQVLCEAIRTDPDQAKLWHRHVVDAVHEQVGGRDDANAIENAIKVAAHFMHQVFGVDLDSELNRVPVAQARKGEFDEAPASPREHWPEMNRRGLWPNNQPIAELVDFVATELPSGNFGQRAAQSGLQSPQPLETSMGSNLGKSSNELHREIDGATGNRINEAINPRARLARQEAEAGLEQTNTSRAAPAPAPASGGTMSQADFTAGSRPRSTPPAELLKKHDSR
jgi:hypothetical protein